MLIRNEDIHNCIEKENGKGYWIGSCPDGCDKYYGESGAYSYYGYTEKNTKLRQGKFISFYEECVVFKGNYFNGKEIGVSFMYEITKKNEPKKIKCFFYDGLIQEKNDFKKILARERIKNL
jgi:hypothetical protein